MGHKSQVHSYFLSFNSYIQTQFGLWVKSFQCDNGVEFVNKDFRNSCLNNGITFRLFRPYTSSQNGKAEKKIRTINNLIRTLLAHAFNPLSFWHHALQMTTYLFNILPSIILNGLTPTQVLYHRRPTYNHLRVFGCLCYPLLQSSTINKLQPRSMPCVFLGYPTEYRGYKCFDLSTRKITISRHVVFDESQFPFSNTSHCILFL